jgi:hypothetical protein
MARRALHITFLSVLLISFVGQATSQWGCVPPNDAFSFCNTSLPMLDRVAALVSNLSVAEKISQMNMYPSGISRLGVPGASFWNEATHGATTRSGINTTMFPMPSLLGCSFNTSLFTEVFNAIGLEARAISNLNKASFVFWAPHINLVRDPRCVDWFAAVLVSVFFQLGHRWLLLFMQMGWYRGQNVLLACLNLHRNFYHCNSCAGGVALKRHQAKIHF